jgi:hypothetical protein
VSAFAIASNLTDGHRRRTGAPPCCHGRRRAHCGAEDVQPIPQMCAGVDGEHAGVALISEDLIGGEQRRLPSSVPAVKYV